VTHYIAEADIQQVFWGELYVESMSVNKLVFLFVCC